jgi:hypothetical protein
MICKVIAPAPVLFERSNIANPMTIAFLVYFGGVLIILSAFFD